MNYTRYLDKIAEKWLFRNKVLILYGPRQVGKTTYAKLLLNRHKPSLYLNCERLQVADLLNSGNSDRIRESFGNVKLVIFDEAQKIKNIGNLLKVLIDTYPEIQYVATGSSSFSLASEISEPLTGRNIKFLMLPLSAGELAAAHGRLEYDNMLTSYMIFGTYPEIVKAPYGDRIQLLDLLSGDYLYRDILQLENLRKPEILSSLLKALALQLGNEVSVRELAVHLKSNQETIQRYLSLLERSFIIFNLTSFSRNLRSELTRSKKYYFFDLGIRNSLLQHFADTDLRNDTGFLWENYCMAERMKRNYTIGRSVNYYFWRTYQQKEIDLIEEEAGMLSAFEFKWSPRPGQKIPSEFRQAYPQATYEIITRENYLDFVLP